MQMTTRDRLLLNARRQFWSHGYSNVPVRQIAAAAGVDVALISRYFGGKRGLFQATLDGAFDLQGLPALDQPALVDALVQVFLNAPRGCDEPSTMRLLLTNAHDAEVGDLVRRTFRDAFQSRITAITGSETRAALLVAVLLGLSVAEKSLHLPGIDIADPQTYEAQLRHLMTAALAFDPAQAAPSDR